MSALTLDPLGAFPPLQDPGGLEWYNSTHADLYSSLYTPGYLYIHITIGAYKSY